MGVAGIEKAALEKLCADVRKKTGCVCQISNELFPKGLTCAGTKEAILDLQERAQEAGALQVKLLKMEGAFHTPCMKKASVELKKTLDAALPRMNPPTCNVFMNSTGKMVPKGSDPKELIPLLCDQLTNPVLWEGCVTSMIESGIEELYEVGPMKQLKAMMKRIDQNM